MPKGPKGEKHPADVIGGAVKIAKIATGETEEDTEEDDGKDKERRLGAISLWLVWRTRQLKNALMHASNR
jgi:hypothetical protein